MFLVCISACGVGFLGCGDDDEDEEGSVADAADTEEQAGEGLTIDAQIEDPCIGLKVEPNAKTYDDECQEIEECTQMPAQDGGCYCAFCGPKGGKVVCIQAQCAQPQ